MAELNDDCAATQIAKCLQYRIMPKIIRIENAHLVTIQDELKAFKRKYQNQYADWQLSIIQTPHRSYSGEEDPILVRNEQGIVQPIGNFSMMINAISDKLEHIAFCAIDKSIAEDKPITDLVKFIQAVTVRDEGEIR